MRIPIHKKLMWWGVAAVTLLLAMWLLGNAILPQQPHRQKQRHRRNAQPHQLLVYRYAHGRVLMRVSRGM